MGMTPICVPLHWLNAGIRTERNGAEELEGAHAGIRARYSDIIDFLRSKAQTWYQAEKIIAEKASISPVLVFQD